MPLDALRTLTNRSLMAAMIEEPRELRTEESLPPETDVSLPFPFQHTFCRYEPIEKRIEKARVLVVDCLLRDEDDLSDVARSEWGSATPAQIKRERYIAGLAVENILGNVARLVKEPVTKVAHLATIATAAKKFNPDAIVLSGTLRDIIELWIDGGAPQNDWVPGTF